MASESVQIETAPTLSVAGKNVSPEPSRGQILWLVVFCYSFYLLVLSLFSNYWEVVGPFGDNQPYAQISSAIRHWDFSQLHPKLFWGLPYAMAVLSKATGASDLKSLLFISMVSSLIAIFIAYRLWGGWVAGFFAVASREWMERSLLGGAEPLFLACIFGSFVAARRQRWLLASLLASLATIVRPMGIFALLGIGIALLVKRDFRRFIAAVLIGATIGFLYILPLMLYLGNPLANVKGYDQADWNAGMPLTIPLVAIAKDALAGRATKLNLARTGLWIVVILVSTVVILGKKSLREYLRKFPVEGEFFAFYLFLLFTYNSYWARAEFPRFAIPIVPFVILGLLPWIPKDRRVLWAFGLFSAALSAVETVGFIHSIEIMKNAL
jgi:hypothetical protein